MNSHDILSAIGDACQERASAIRAVTRLVPVDGPGGKVCPPTYEGGNYAFEDRIVNGETIKTVLLDSVQSQANRLEEALLEAYRAGDINLPVFEMDIDGHGTLTSLDVPHRIHDAIFRDSLWDGKPFRESDGGKRLAQARAWNATAFYEYSPTSLLFGTWDSQSGAGVTSAKVARALVSEIVGLHAQKGVRTASRVDPLGIKALKGIVYKSAAEHWTLDPQKADQKKGKPELFGKDGKPSEINHGNVTPAITSEALGRSGKTEVKIHGGVTFREALQTTVLSLTQLRRLRFPDSGGETSPQRDQAGRTVLAALGIYAITLQWQSGYQLRSRCQLVPVELPKLEMIGPTAGDVTLLAVEATLARDTLLRACERAEGMGLCCEKGSIRLQPQKKLLELVSLSDQAVEDSEDDK